MTYRARFLVLGAYLFLAAGCAAGIPPVTTGGMGVTIRKAEPPANAQELGPIEVQHGSGCGAYGALGSYEGAYNMLKNKAAEMGANYVRIDSITEPYSDGQCGHNAFVLRGIGFRVAGAPAEVHTAAGCRSDKDCDASQLCQCASGANCQVGMCVARPEPPAAADASPGCRSDKDCDASQLCQCASGANCQVGQCVVRPTT